MTRTGRLLPVVATLALAVGAAALSTPATAQPWQLERPVGDPEVVRRYREILARDPLSERGLEGLIGESGPGGGVPALIEEYAARAAADSEEAGAHVVLARLRLHQGQYAEALPALDRAIALGFDAGGVYRLRGEARGHLGEPEAAAADYEEALARARYEPERIDVLRSLGDLQLALGDVDAALASYGRIAELAPRDRYVRQELAQILYDAGLRDEALARYREVVELAGSNTRDRATALREVALLEAELGRHDQALATWRRILGLVGDDHWLTREAREGLVLSYREAGRLPELVAELEGRRDAFSRSQRPRLLVELGRREEAEAAYVELVASGRHEAEDVLAYAALLYERGASAEADALLAEAGARWPERLELVLAVADAALEAGRRFDASYAVRAAAPRFWDDASALDALGHRLREAGDAEESARVVARLRELSPEDPAPLMALARAALERGDPEAARVALEPLTASDDPAQHLVAVELLAEVGDAERAARLLAEAVARFPGDDQLALLALQSAPPDDAQGLMSAARALLVRARDRDVAFAAFDVYLELARRFGVADWAAEELASEYLAGGAELGVGRAALLAALATGRGAQARALLQRLDATTSDSRWRGAELVVAAVERWPHPAALPVLRSLGAGDDSGGWRFTLAAASLELAAGREDAARTSLEAVLADVGELPAVRFEIGAVWARFDAPSERATGCRLQEDAMDAEPRHLPYRIGAANCRLDLGQGGAAYQLALDGFEVVRDPLEAEALLDVAVQALPPEGGHGELYAAVRERLRARAVLAAWLEERIPNE